MPVIISSKGKDFDVWRPAEEFAVTCRQTLLSRTDSLLSDQAEALLMAVDTELGNKIAVHEANLARLRELTEHAGHAAGPGELKGVVTEFYAAAYTFFGRNRSSTAFYRLSDSFLRAVAAAIVGHAKHELGAGDKLPSMALIVLGSGGRQEFSPFSRLPFLVIHGEANPSGSIPLRLFGKILHEAFEEAGFSPDAVVTPRNPAWNSDLTHWRHDLVQKIGQGTQSEMIDLLRLGDQVTIYDEGPGEEFREHCLSLLRNSRTTLDLMVRRVLDLPRGVGLMGGLKYEKRGACHGFFNLATHALMPLVAAVGALALLKGVTESGTMERIRSLLKRGELNVEMTERLLESWHLFNELRLDREATLKPNWKQQNVLCLDTVEWDSATLDHFKECVETVSTLHRQVGIAFTTHLERI